MKQTKPDWELTIIEGLNGYVLKNIELLDDSAFAMRWNVIERDDKEFGDITKLLYFVADFFGYPYDKFSHKNLNIKWNEKGYKVES